MELTKNVFDYDNEISIIKRGAMDHQFPIKAGQGDILPLQLLAMEYSTGKLVKYASGGSGGTNVPLTLYTGTETLDATSEITAPCLVSNSIVNEAAVNGFDVSTDFEVVAVLFGNGIRFEEVR